MKKAKQIRKRQKTFSLSSKEVHNLFQHFQSLTFFLDALPLLRFILFPPFFAFSDNHSHEKSYPLPVIFLTFWSFKKNNRAPTSLPQMYLTKFFQLTRFYAQLLKYSEKCAFRDWSERVYYNSIKHAAYVTRVHCWDIMQAAYVIGTSARNSRYIL